MTYAKECKICDEYVYLPHKLPSGKPLNLEISFHARNDSEPDEQQRKAGYYWSGPQLSG